MWKDEDAFVKRISIFIRISFGVYDSFLTGNVHFRFQRLNQHVTSTIGRQFLVSFSTSLTPPCKSGCRPIKDSSSFQSP
ncbi:hypothetical protein RIF29_22389 [Crotalaria pallida]|uniref:Uncharacterized protein n=1 Tax=Crotalaria pallida TaxID=3830 RepID=A0AAN9F965_CROPI